MRRPAVDYIPLVRLVPFDKAKAWPIASTRLFKTRRAVVIVFLLVTLCLFLIVVEHFADQLSILTDEVLEEEDSSLADDSLTLALGYPNAYLLVPSSVPAPPPSVHPPLHSAHDLPSHCLDNYLSKGERCHLSAVPDMHVVWTWVNGSDVLLQQAKQRVQDHYGEHDPYRPLNIGNQARQYRDFDELRHSMRSVLQNFRSHTRHFHLIASDFAIPLTSPNLTTQPESWRLGQVPQWLDTTRRTAGWMDGNVELSITHHAGLFSPYNDTVFNSYAIESQLGHLTSISDNFVYMNDDFFMASPLTPVSFYTSTYGIVLRMQPDLLVSSAKPAMNTKGEWRSLEQSNYLLSLRFGFRSRPYLVHEAKSASLPLLREVSAIWSTHIAETATHAFRETWEGDGDINAMFMMTHFVVERWREALLWSWTVAKIGGLDDSWGEAETARAWAEVSGAPGAASADVRASRRQTLDKSRIARNLKVAGYTEDGKTSYVFSSLDGYPYSGLGRKGQPRWPNYVDGLVSQMPQCRINYDECFAPMVHISTASAAFKHLAFDKPQCGDCLIIDLVGANGPLGLESFLPPLSRTLPSSAGNVNMPEQEDPPHLPLVDKWQDGDYSLRSVMRSSHDGRVRDWTLHLLQRYRFVIGSTASMFERVTNPSSARGVIRTIENTKDIALLCINDDVDVSPEEVGEVLRSWQETRWSTPAAWEH